MSFQEREKERARLRARLAELEKEDDFDELRKLEDFTDEEKIEAFDELHSFCMTTMNQLKDTGSSKDHIHYTYEATMKATLGPKVFTIYNKLV